MLTDMDQPLGRAVGNALEIREAVATVRGEGPDDFSELVLASAAHLLALSDLDVDEFAARKLAEDAVSDGTALAAYDRWIEAQGGDPDPGALPRAAVIREVVSPADGYVERLGAIAIGHAALHLGAGRRTKEDAIDYAVGVVCLRKRGDAVSAGDVLAEIHAADEASAEAAAAEVLAAYELGGEQPRPRRIVLDTIG
jgi:pyrimidine-nucleoside phosphorylase